MGPRGELGSKAGNARLAGLTSCTVRDSESQLPWGVTGLLSANAGAGLPRLSLQELLPLGVPAELSLLLLSLL